MATVTYPEGGPEPFEVPDSDTALHAYYRGEGATVELDESHASSFPVVQQPDGQQAEEPPAVEAVTVESAHDAALDAALDLDDEHDQH